MPYAAARLARAVLGAITMPDQPSVRDLTLDRIARAGGTAVSGVMVGAATGGTIAGPVGAVVGAVVGGAAGVAVGVSVALDAIREERGK